MKSQVRFPVLPWGFLLEGEDPLGDHGLASLVELSLRPLLVLHIHISPSTSSGQRNCASLASHPQKSVTLRPQPGGESTKSIRDMWWHCRGKKPYRLKYLTQLNISLRVIKLRTVISFQYAALSEHTQRGIVETCTNQHQKQLICKILNYNFSRA
jgi:hypothetical protein